MTSSKPSSTSRDSKHSSQSSTLRVSRSTRHLPRILPRKPLPPLVNSGRTSRLGLPCKDNFLIGRTSFLCSSFVPRSTACQKLQKYLRSKFSITSNTWKTTRALTSSLKVRLTNSEDSCTMWSASSPTSFSLKTSLVCTTTTKRTDS